MSNTIARITSKSIIFQEITSFSLIKNTDIQHTKPELKKGFSDWINSGDLLKAEFDLNKIANIEFCLEFNELKLDFGFKNCVESYEINHLEKTIKIFKRIENKIEKKLRTSNQSFNTLTKKELIALLFKNLDVIGGTLHTANSKLCFNKQNFANNIDHIATVLENN